MSDTKVPPSEPITATLPTKSDGRSYNIVKQKPGTLRVVAPGQGSVTLHGQGDYVVMKGGGKRWKLAEVRPRWKRLTWWFSMARNLLRRPTF